MSGYGCQSDHNHSRPRALVERAAGRRHRVRRTGSRGGARGFAPVSFTSYQRQSDSTRPDYLTRARLRMHAAYAIQQCSKALDTLLAVHGEAAVSEFSILNIYMRGMHTATKHAMISPETNAELFGKALLGVQPNITPLI